MLLLPEQGASAEGEHDEQADTVACPGRWTVAVVCGRFPWRIVQAGVFVESGRRAVYTDAEDVNFWQGVDLSRIDAVVMAMNDLESKLFAARQLRARGFPGPIVSQALYEDHVAQITEAGADHTHLTFREAGMRLAERTRQVLEGEEAADAPDAEALSRPSSP